MLASVILTFRSHCDYKDGEGGPQSKDRPPLVAHPQAAHPLPAGAPLHLRAGAPPDMRFSARPGPSEVPATPRMLCPAAEAPPTQGQAASSSAARCNLKYNQEQLRGGNILRD